MHALAVGDDEIVHLLVFEAVMNVKSARSLHIYRHLFKVHGAAGGVSF